MATITTTTATTNTATPCSTASDKTSPLSGSNARTSTTPMNLPTQIPLIHAKNAQMDELVLPASTFASPSSTLIRNSDFFYDSDSHEDEMELSFNCMYIEDPNGLSLLTDNDEDEDEGFMSSDSVPLINRLTPPPPLFNSAAAFGPCDSSSTTDSVCHDDGPQGDEKNHKESLHSLTIIVPSLNMAPSPPGTAAKTAKDPEKQFVPAQPSTLRKSSHKSFDWNVNTKPESYALNDYLVQHIHSLYDESLSE